MIKSLKNSFYLASIACMLSGVGCASEGMQLRLEKGVGQFSFALDSNPTTGYRWKIDNYDKQQIEMIACDYLASKPGLIGSGGKQEFKFKVLNPSKSLDTKIKLSYARPWEKSSVKTQVVHVYNGF